MVGVSAPAARADVSRLAGGWQESAVVSVHLLRGVSSLVRQLALLPQDASEYSARLSRPQSPQWDRLLLSLLARQKECGWAWMVIGVCGCTGCDMEYVAHTPITIHTQPTPTTNQIHIYTHTYTHPHPHQHTHTHPHPPTPTHHPLPPTHPRTHPRTHSHTHTPTHINETNINDWD